ncbi:unnamed protein product [Gordionus sp. m RMFG-2023]|uniref:ribosomal RNA processing protein 1 homolog B-like n=1 Tax=Gordionus sp. m RMFG-2023 TaxID=3053472 RepID=UPI0030E5F369
MEIHDTLNLLSSNDEHSRTISFEKLAGILSQIDLKYDEKDYFKIWKALFFHLWMTDKMINQENVASDISQILLDFHETSNSFLFFDTFLQTIDREYKVIDAYRIDKFLLLTRKMIYQSFKLLANNDWEGAYCKPFFDIITKSVLTKSQNVTDTPHNISFVFHIIDIYLPELLQVGRSSITCSKALKMLTPFFHIMSIEKSRQIIDRINLNIFEYIMTQSEVEQKLCQEAEGEINLDLPYFHNKHSKKEFRADNTYIFINYDEIAKILYQHGSDKKCPPKNRKIIYDLTQKFEKLARGEYPLIEEYKVQNSLKRAHKKSAFLKLITSDESGINKKRQKLSKNKKIKT